MGKKAVFSLFDFGLRFLLFLFCLFTALGCAAPYANPNRYPFIGCVAVALPFLLPGNLMLLLYGGIRKKKWAFLPAVVLLLNLNYLTSVLHVSFAGSGKGENTIRIATYNVHGFNREKTGYSAKQIAGFLEKEKIDIVCFQEFTAIRTFPIDSLLKVFVRFPYRHIPRRSDQSTRVAVFSRYPLTDSVFIPFPESANCGQSVDLSVKGKKLKIFNVHLQTTGLSREQSRQAARNVYDGREEKIKSAGALCNVLLENYRIRVEQARTIREQIEHSAVPVILCGDFNDTPASYTYRSIKGKLHDGFKTCGNGYQYTFRGYFRLLRLDYVFHAPSLRGIRYDAPDCRWSDHNPVVMEIGI